MYPRSNPMYPRTRFEGFMVEPWVTFLLILFLIAFQSPALGADDRQVTVQLDPYAVSADGTVEYDFAVSNDSSERTVTRLDLVSRAGARFELFRDGSVFSLDSGAGGTSISLDFTMHAATGLAPGTFDGSSANAMEAPGRDGFEVTVHFDDGARLTGILVDVGDSDDDDPALWQFDTSAPAYGARDEDRVSFTGDFESGALDAADWATLDTAGIKVVSDTARSGRYAAEFRIDASDLRHDAASGRGAEIVAMAPQPVAASGDAWDDVGVGHTKAEGVTRWYGFSSYVPSDWQAEPDAGPVALMRLVSHADDDAGGYDRRIDGAAVSLAVMPDGHYRIDNRWDASPYSDTAGGYPREESFPLGPVVKGAWVDWVFRVHWAYDETGTLEAWQNGVKVVDVKGRGVSFNDEGGIAFRLGLHGGGDSLEVPRVVRLDDVRIGDERANYTDVAPGGISGAIDLAHAGVSSSLDDGSVTVGATSAAVYLWEGRVSAGNEDAEEHIGTGRVNVGSADLDLGYDGGRKLVGVRFANVGIPKGAHVVRAYLQFTARAAASGAVTLNVRGETSDSAAAFTTTARNLSRRVATAAEVAWTIPPWSVAGESGTAQRTPDLSAIVEEIVSRSGWAPGNALALLVGGSGVGKRTAHSFNGSAAAAPVLHVEYAVGDGDDSVPVPNEAPLASISGPSDGALYAQGSSITFTGSALDAEDGNLTGKLVWTSSRDGAIGRGGNVTTSALSVGVHTVTASVTDWGGLTHSTTVAVTVTATGTPSAWEGRFLNLRGNLDAIQSGVRTLAVRPKTPQV